ncbi:DNA-binding XRE family transcriptional regulator [Neorhizobium huautlense]|uniref:DNA-binding XRE family transcriptional regulator n=2 Tax=Neorhizobium huautlense TaxID=67774 RepID=A0ABT9PTY4_9HYPH|nr:DNA-binding XRE family transcriptional regulator [Neorhizobium huautlense]
MDLAARETKDLLQSPEYKAQQAAELAELCKAWREKADIPASRAAQVLGIPKRTYEGIEQGRGFPYPLLLTHAIRSFD